MSSINYPIIAYSKAPEQRDSDDWKEIKICGKFLSSAYRSQMTKEKAEEIAKLWNEHNTQS
jgi:hypothetical protein